VFKNGVVDAIEIFFLTRLKGWSCAKYRRLRVNFSFFDWFLCPVYVWKPFPNLLYILIKYGCIFPIHVKVKFL